MRLCAGGRRRVRSAHAEWAWNGSVVTYRPHRVRDADPTGAGASNRG